MTDRIEIGREKLGTPIMLFSSALAELLEQPAWAGVEARAVHYYLEKMLMGTLGLLGSLDNALSDEALAKVEPVRVQEVCLLLVRDMLRHNRERIQEGGLSEEQVTRLCAQVAKANGLSLEGLPGREEAFDIDDVRAEWAHLVFRHVGAEEDVADHAARLAVAHNAIVTGVDEDVLDPDRPGAGDAQEDATTALWYGYEETSQPYLLRRAAAVVMLIEARAAAAREAWPEAVEAIDISEHFLGRLIEDEPEELDRSELESLRDEAAATKGSIAKQEAPSTQASELLKHEEDLAGVYRIRFGEESDRPEACGFCMKDRTMVDNLIEGPAGFICDGCVMVCHGLITGQQ